MLAHFANEGAAVLVIFLRTTNAQICRPAKAPGPRKKYSRGGSPFRWGTDRTDAKSASNNATVSPAEVILDTDINGRSDKLFDASHHRLGWKDERHRSLALISIIVS